ncbi:hypothetical protein SCA6_006223 [Theobroma cacao]
MPNVRNRVPGPVCKSCGLFEFKTATTVLNLAWKVPTRKPKKKKRGKENYESKSAGAGVRSRRRRHRFTFFVLLNLGDGGSEERVCTEKKLLP